MTEGEFLDFARDAARRATSTPGRIGNLVLTQARRANEPTLREPEMRTAFQYESDNHNLLYGVEVPTIYTYQFTGISRGRARTDFAILDPASPTTDRDVLVEFKEGQPSIKQIEAAGDIIADFPAISKDLEKQLAEPVRYGWCMFHICQATDSETIPALIEKYDSAMRNALRNAAKTVEFHTGSNQPLNDVQNGRWSVLLFLVLHQRGKAYANLGACLHIGTWNGIQWEVKQDTCFP